MARKGQSVVSVNGNGDIVGYYENVREAARVNHSLPKNIWFAINKKTFHHKHLWMREKDYRELWYEGRTDELRYSFKEWRSEVAKKGRRNMSFKQKEQWKKNLSESKKKRNKTMPEHKVPLLCVTTGEVYPSQAHLAKTLGITRSAVNFAARTGYRVKGLIVKKITKEEYEQRRNQKDT